MERNHFFLNRIYIILMILAFSSCKTNVNDKGDYQHTSIICDDKYLEVYKTFGSGAFGGDLIAHYLTDSVNFRVFIGEFDNSKKHFSYKCKGDSLFIYKMSKRKNENSYKLEKLDSYSLSKLERMHNLLDAKIPYIAK